MKNRLRLAAVAVLSSSTLVWVAAAAEAGIKWK